MNKHDKIIQLLAIYDDLNETQRAQVDEHMITCADCAARLAAYQAMDRNIQQLPRLQPEPTFRQDFYTQLESNMTNYKRNKQIRRIPAFAVQLLVVGALILLGISFWASLRSQEVSVSAPIPVTVVSEEANDEPKFSINDYTLEHKNYQPGDTVSVQAVWEELWPTGDEQVELLLVDKEGEHIAQSHTPLTAGRFSQVEATYELTLPDNIKNGRYLLDFSVNNQETGERIPTAFQSQVIYVGEEKIPTPVGEAPVIRLESWSPNGQYLMFREYTEAEIRNGDVGAQRVYNVAAGEYCPHAVDVRPGNVEEWLVWIDDHTYAYISASGGLASRKACDLSETSSYNREWEVLAILGQSHNLETLLLATSDGYVLVNPKSGPDIKINGIPKDEIISDARFSPDNQILALTTNIGTLNLVNTNTGNIVQTIPWQLAGQLPDPIWLSNDLLLARNLWLPKEHALVTQPTNPDPFAQPGPFLVNIDGTITPLETIFGESIDETRQRIIAAPDIEQGSYAILLYNDPEKGEKAPIRVYHSTTVEVETFAQEEIWSEGITENGRYLLTSEERNYGNASGTSTAVLGIEVKSEIDEMEMFLYERSYLVREVTAVGEEPRLFMITTDLNALTPVWDSNYDHFALLNSYHLLETRPFPTFSHFNFWDQELGYAVIEDVLWSPDQQHLAAVGGMSGVMQSGLFILETEGFESKALD